MAADNAKSDMKAHAGTYARFLSMFKMGTIVCAVVAALVVLIISR